MEKQQKELTKQLKKFKVLGPVATVYGSSNTGSWRIERPEVDFEKCVKCSTSEKFCPAGVITVDKEAEIPVFDWKYCKGCGICANECPKDAICMIDEKEARN